MHALTDENGEQVIITIEPDETKEIEDFIAEIWLKTGDVVKVDDGSKDKEIERLKAENAKLKAEQDNERKEKLLNLCKEYGVKITNPKTVKIETLEKKLDEFTAKQRTE